MKDLDKGKLEESINNIYEILKSTGQRVHIVLGSVNNTIKFEGEKDYMNIPEFMEELNNPIKIIERELKESGQLTDKYNSLFLREVLEKHIKKSK